MRREVARRRPLARRNQGLGSLDGCCDSLPSDGGLRVGKSGRARPVSAVGAGFAAPWRGYAKVFSRRARPEDCRCGWQKARRSPSALPNPEAPSTPSCSLWGATARPSGPGDGSAAVTCLDLLLLRRVVTRCKRVTKGRSRRLHECRAPGARRPVPGLSDRSGAGNPSRTSNATRPAKTTEAACRKSAPRWIGVHLWRRRRINRHIEQVERSWLYRTKAAGLNLSHDSDRRARPARLRRARSSRRAPETQDQPHRRRLRSVLGGCTGDRLAGRLARHAQTLAPVAPAKLHGLNLARSFGLAEPGHQRHGTKYASGRVCALLLAASRPAIGLFPPMRLLCRDFVPARAVAVPPQIPRPAFISAASPSVEPPAQRSWLLQVDRGREMRAGRERAARGRYHRRR